MTLAKLAKDLGTTPMTISRYENGQRQPDNETLTKIADYFEVSVDFLLERTDIADFRDFDSATIQIPVYTEYMTNKKNIPESSFEIVASLYDFVINPDKLIGFREMDSRYIPYFLPGDLLIVELGESITVYSPFYLAVVGGFNRILELISDGKQHVFTYPAIEAKPILHDFEIIGRVITVHRRI